MDFKEFLIQEDYQYSQQEIANMYFAPYSSMKVREIAEKTGCSIAELYRIVRSFGTPNRRGTRRHLVDALASSGLDSDCIAELTKYSPDYVRRLLARKFNDF